MRKFEHPHPSRRAVLAGAAALAVPALIARADGMAPRRARRSSSAPGAGITPISCTRTSRCRSSRRRAGRWCRIPESDAPRRAKMVAEKRLPRGTSDVQALSDLNVAEMTAAGVLEKIDYSKLARAPEILPVLKIGLRGAAYLFGPRPRLQSEAHPDGADLAQRSLRWEERRQGRRHRHPIYLHRHGRRARGWRKLHRFRAGEGQAHGAQEAGRQDLPDQ